MAGAVGLGYTALLLDGVEASVADPAGLAQVMDLEESQGSLAQMGDDQLAVSTRRAEQESLELGDVVPVGFTDGTTTDLTVGAIYDRWHLMGDVIIPPAVYLPHAVWPPWEGRAACASAPGAGCPDPPCSPCGPIPCSAADAAEPARGAGPRAPPLGMTTSG